MASARPAAKAGKARNATKARNAKAGKGTNATRSKKATKATKARNASKPGPASRSGKPARAAAKAKARPGKASARATRKAAAPRAARPARAAAKPAPVKRAARAEASRPQGAKAQAPPAPADAKAAARTAKPAPSPAAGKGVPSRPGKEGDADLSVGGQIYRNGRLTEGVLHIDTRSGRIVRIAKSTTLATHLDFGSRLVLPGAIDVHVHFREPGHTHKEDLTTGSVAAAFGGVTGYVDMPNTLPATTTLRTLKDKLALMAARSVVDYAAFAGGSWYVGDLPQMLRYAAGVKTYLGATTGDLLLDDAERFQQILTAAGNAGRPVVLHAESQRILHQMRRQEGTLNDHDVFRPPLAEVEAIYDGMKAVAAVKKPPRIHVAHVASREAVQATATAGFSLGATPHHLLLDTSVPLTHAYGKVNPPLRSPAARQALFELFAAGRIPIVESDHAPHTAVEKEDNFHAAPSGMPGVETMVPLLLAQVKAGTLPLERVVDAVTVNPAALLGVADRGALEPGMRADFAVYDLKAGTKVQGDRLHSRCGWSPFEGHTAIFPLHTYLAGKPVVQDGSLVAQPGSGRSLLPQPKE